MKTIETNLQVSEDKTVYLTLPVVTELQPGVYHVVVVIDEKSIQPVKETKKEPLKLNVFKLKTTHPPGPLSFASQKRGGVRRGSKKGESRKFVFPCSPSLFQREGARG